MWCAQLPNLTCVPLTVCSGACLKIVEVCFYDAHVVPIQFTKGGFNDYNITVIIIKVMQHNTHAHNKLYEQRAEHSNTTHRDFVLHRILARANT
jgi:hypothetical protein